MVTHDLIKKIKNGMYDETLKDIYVDEKKIAYERERYIKAIESYTEHFGEGEIFPSLNSSDRIVPINVSNAAEEDNPAPINTSLVTKA